MCSHQKVEELACCGVALRLYEAFNLLASGGRWYSRMKRLAFTTNTHDARARYKGHPDLPFRYNSRGAPLAANQHALHFGPRMLMSLFAPSSEDQHHHCAARGSASPRDQGYSHLTSPRMESLSKQLVARLDEVVKTQTEQTKLIRALDQRHVHIANTNGGSSLADPRPPFSGFTTDTPPNSQRSTAFDVNEASSVFKPATHPALRTKAFRRASWAWDPQFQEDLNHSFKVGKPLRSAGSQCTTHACVLDVLQSDTRLRRHSCTRSPSRSFE